MRALLSLTMLFLATSAFAQDEEAAAPAEPTPAATAVTTTTSAKESKLVAVLDLKAGEGAARQASALTTMLTAEVSAHDGHRAVSRNELQALLQHQTMAQLSGCDEARCMADVAHLVNADYVVSGSVEKLEGATVVALTLIDAGAEGGDATVVGRQKAAWRGSDEELLLVMRPLVHRLFDPAQAHAHKGELELFLPEGAEVFLNDKALGTAPLTRVADLPTGVHRLHVKKDGYSDENVDLVVARNETTIVRVDLEPIPLLEQPWFWATAGGVVLIAGGLAAGVTTYAILTQDQPTKVVLGR